MDDVSVFASLPRSFLFAAQLGILGVLGARRIRVVAAAQQVQITSSIAEGLEEEENLSCEPTFAILTTLNLRSQQVIKSMSV